MEMDQPSSSASEVSFDQYVGRRFEEFKRYINWTKDDDDCSRRLLELLEPHFDHMVSDFYQEILNHPAALRVITGGEQQIERLKVSLREWLGEALLGQHDAAYLEKRWRIGRKHVDIGLDQVYVNAAFARIRGHLGSVLENLEELSANERDLLQRSLNKRLDFELALMSDSYYKEYQSRQIPVNHARLGQQKRLALLSRDALAGAPLEVLYDQAIAYLTESLQADCCELLKFVPERNTFFFRSASGWPKEILGQSIGDLEVGSYFDMILSSKDSMEVDDHDLQTDLEYPALFKKQRIVSSIQVAIRNENEIYGILAVHFRQHRQFQASDHDFLISLANILANAIHRKGIENQQRQSEHQLRRLIDRLPAGAVYVVNDMLQVNQGVENMTGYTREELNSLDDWKKLLVEPEVDESSPGPADPHAGKIQQSEVRIQRADREVRTIAKLKFESAIDEIWLLHDITDSEDQRRQQLQAERLAAIGQMITGIAHESRNALQRIQACTEMLELEFEPASEEMKLIGRLQQAQDDLQWLFDEVRSYAAPIVLETKPVDLIATCRRAWDQTEPLRRNRDATLEISGGRDVTLQADEFRLIQVFRNLLENSLAATPDPARICAEIETGDSSHIVITLTDNGPGFDETVARRMLDPFFTTKTKGSGLGMAIASRIVEAHGGTITPVSQAGSGAKFIVSISAGGIPLR